MAPERSEPTHPKADCSHQLGVRQADGVRFVYAIVAGMPGDRDNVPSIASACLSTSRSLIAQSSHCAAIQTSSASAPPCQLILPSGAGGHGVSPPFWSTTSNPAGVVPVAGGLYLRKMGEWP